MKSTIIIGAGLMGTAVAYAMLKLGFKVYLYDNIGISYENCSKISSLSCTYPHTHFYPYNDLDVLKKDIDGCDVVISCAPYKFNLDFFHLAQEMNAAYCDLGGNPEMSELIQKENKNSSKPVFTDLGLAPGFANILAEAAYNAAAKPVKKVSMRCGGLPKKPSNYLNYNLVFNVEGLRNEYSGECEVIRDGEVKMLPALSETKLINWNGIALEEFHTRGGLSTSLKLMLERNIQELDYKTLRFAGHIEVIKFLLEDCKLDNDTFNKAIENACPKTDKDIVLLSAEADNTHYSLLIECDEYWTAMQKGTAFPTAAVAAIMVNTEFNKPVLDYSDVPIDMFKDNLKIICGEELVF